MWWQVAELFHFAETAGAQIRLRDADALSLTWDCGRSWQHVWNTSGEHAQAFYGESEYAETRVPTMISDYSELMLNWAVLRIGRKALLQGLGGDSGARKRPKCGSALGL